ncbi:hypothetical protein RB653_001811 [Dictyostelium firmibasis]|uniref:Uncharacterized protein n=1 Tax=Dictyostelium firmibasis TaxID=79012 RepID=A0AAN7YMH7_9MYCE
MNNRTPTKIVDNSRIVENPELFQTHSDGEASDAITVSQLAKMVKDLERKLAEKTNEMEKFKDNSRRIMDSKTVESVKTAANGEIQYQRFVDFCPLFNIKPNLSEFLRNGCANDKTAPHLDCYDKEVEGEELKSILRRVHKAHKEAERASDLPVIIMDLVEAVTNSQKINSSFETDKNLDRVYNFINIYSPPHYNGKTVEEKFNKDCENKVKICKEMLIASVHPQFASEVRALISNEKCIDASRSKISDFIFNNEIRLKSFTGKRQREENITSPGNARLQSPKPIQPAERKAMLEGIRKKGSGCGPNVNLTTINDNILLFRSNNNVCLNCGRNHLVKECRAQSSNEKVQIDKSQKDHDQLNDHDSLKKLEDIYFNLKHSNNESENDDPNKGQNKIKKFLQKVYEVKLKHNEEIEIPSKVKIEKPIKIINKEIDNKIKDNNKNYIVNLFNQLKETNFNFDSIKRKGEEKVKEIYEIRFNENKKPLITMVANSSIGNKDIMIPIVKGIMIENKNNMNKPRLILDPKKVNETIKVILDTGSNISLINRKLLTEEMKSMIHNSKDIVEFPLLGIKESNVQDVNIQLGDDVYKFIVTDVEVVDVLIEGIE